jgi:pyruvate/2-oxoglutarate dehydrogenase complex dihydrolipoamide acyltransferase (E2) component
MAGHELRLPGIGMAMTEASITEWLVDDGGQVSEGQPLATIETDKVDAEVEAPASGTIEIRVEAGQTIPVGTLIAVIS